MPLVNTNPKFADTTVYCEATRFDLIVKHNQRVTQSINVHQIDLEYQKVKAAPDLNYTIDASKVNGFGIIATRQYYFTLLSGTNFRGKFIVDKDHATAVDPANIFRSVTGTETLILQSSGNDAFFQAEININLETAGLYKFRFRVGYDLSDTSKSRYSPWLYLTRRS